MVLFYHYCARGFSNCFLAGQETNESDPDQRREALIIDPAQIDEAIVTFIESNNYRLKAVLLTHEHANHSYGLRSLMRIYENLEIYAANPEVHGFKTNMLHDGDTFTTAGFDIEAIAVPGHSADSMIYRIDHTLFSGDALTAGLIGTTANSYAAMREISAIQRKLFGLPGNYLVFPAHGPPSTLETERHFNAGIAIYEQNAHRSTVRSTFNLDLLE
jgi:glyoxylase-like metal-dependent hydrolase (beta-lactamase superfamily II)